MKTIPVREEDLRFLLHALTEALHLAKTGEEHSARASDEQHDQAMKHLETVSAARDLVRAYLASS